MWTPFVEAAHEFFECPRRIIIGHLLDLGQSPPY
jgi:hypothetical protein